MPFLGVILSIAAQLESRSLRHSIDGGDTVQRFLRAGLIDRLIITRVPVLIGNGIPLFGDLARDLQLLHIAPRSFPSGLVQSEYPLGEASEPQPAPLWV